jgi:hypothetical protein
MAERENAANVGSESGVGQASSYHTIQLLTLFGGRSKQQKRPIRPGDFRAHSSEAHAASIACVNSNRRRTNCRTQCRAVLRVRVAIGRKTGVSHGDNYGNRTDSVSL